MDKIDELLRKDCYIIDVLPEQVEKDSTGQYFNIEYYFLNSNKRFEIKDKFVNVILKLMCYYNTAILWEKWIEQPAPEIIDKIVSEIMNNHSGTLNILFSGENTLLVFEWDCLNLSVYNPSEKIQSIIDKIAFSEGLFWRKSKN